MELQYLPMEVLLPRWYIEVNLPILSLFMNSYNEIEMFMNFPFLKYIIIIIKYVCTIIKLMCLIK